MKNTGERKRAKRGESAASQGAVDPERIRAAVAEHLLLPEAGATVGACRVTFARRNVTRGLFHYAVDLALADGGPAREATVTGVSYGDDRTRNVWQRFQTHWPDPLVPVGSLRPIAYDPELDLLLQAFPFDFRLPAMRPVLEGDHVELARALVPRLGPGLWRIDDWRAEAVRYRVDLRATVRLEIDGTSDAGAGEPGSARFYVKIYDQPAAAAQAAETDRLIREAMEAAPGNALALAPVAAAIVPDRIVCWEEVTGDSLLDVLVSHEGAEETAPAEAAVRLAARALAEFHRLPVAAGSGREEPRGSEDRVRQETARLRKDRPDLAALVDEVEAGVAAADAAAGEREPRPVHGDLKPAHVILHGDRATLLDFDKFSLGDPMLDVANMAIRLGRGARGNRLLMGSLAGVFVEEYLAHVPADWAPGLAPAWAGALLRQASTGGTAMRDRREALRDGADARRADENEQMLRDALELLAGAA